MMIEQYYVQIDFIIKSLNLRLFFNPRLESCCNVRPTYYHLKGSFTHSYQRISCN